jgi:hypothetical protein
MKGEYDAAIQDFNNALELDPEDAFAYRGRGAAYHDKDEYDAAIRDLTHALGLDPEDAFAYSRRGEAYRMKGEYDAAIRDLTHALGLDPEDAFAYRCRGDAYFAKGDHERAAEDYAAALKIDPDYNREWMDGLETLLEEGYHFEGVEQPEEQADDEDGDENGIYFQCPHCGEEYLVSDPDDLPDNPIECSNCGEEFKIAFWGECKECGQSVGFRPPSIGSTLSDIARGVFESFSNPKSFSEVGKGLLGSLAGPADALAMGECPRCHRDHLQCPKCRESVLYNADEDEDPVVQCEKCRKKMRRPNYGRVL